MTGARDRTNSARVSIRGGKLKIKKDCSGGWMEFRKLPTRPSVYYLNGMLEEFINADEGVQGVINLNWGAEGGFGAAFASTNREILLLYIILEDFRLNLVAFVKKVET